MGQILESIHVGLSHPQFEPSIPHKTVLATTGRLLGNVTISLQDLNRSLKEKQGQLPVEVWDRERLIDFFESSGLEGIYSVTASGFLSYGNFHTLYGHALQGSISEEEIENNSRHWLSAELDSNKRLTGVAIEGEIIAQKCT